MGHVHEVKPYTKTHSSCFGGFTSSIWWNCWCPFLSIFNCFFTSSTYSKPNCPTKISILMPLTTCFRSKKCPLAVLPKKPLCLFQRCRQNSEVGGGKHVKRKIPRPLYRGLGILLHWGPGAKPLVRGLAAKQSLQCWKLASFWCEFFNKSWENLCLKQYNEGLQQNA